MSEETNAPSGEGITVVTAEAGIPAELTMNGAARALSDMREKRNKSPAESAEPATAEPELSGEDNAAPPQEATGETQEADPAEVPPLDLPRSWTKEQTEHWNALPRSTQEFLTEQASKTSEAVRRSQNEAAESRKAAEAERKQAEEVRKSYEAKLPALMESLQRQSEFADIKTMDDVRKLQTEDPFRFQQWQVYQMDAQAVEGERRQAEQRQQHEKANARQAYAQEQDLKLQELLPDMKNPDKASAIRAKAVEMLVNDYGFSQSELSQTIETDDGHKLLNDARWQKMVADAMAYQELRKAPQKAAPKTLPPVQRPGVSKPHGNSASERVQALENQLTNTGDIKFAQRLLAERRRVS